MAYVFQYKHNQAVTPGEARQAWAPSSPPQKKEGRKGKEKKKEKGKEKET